MSGEQCCENPPATDHDGGLGYVGEIAGLKAYIHGSFDSKKALIFASDAFGYDGVPVRKLADKAAAAGFLVVVPDFFHGDPLDRNRLHEILHEWRKAHSTEKGCEDALKIIAELKSKGITAIGAAGFCWGGSMVVKLAKHGDIQAGVALHPGPIDVEDIHNVKAHLAILGAEHDDLCPPEQIHHFGGILAAKPEVESYIKIYPGVAHGWASRYDENHDHARNSAEDAHTEMLDWFIKYVQ